MTTAADILEHDASEAFINLLLIKSDSPHKYEFVQHMREAAVMSHYKYGWVHDKPASHYKMLMGFEAHAKDGNAEHFINMANYAMFQYMVDAPHEEYINIALNAIDSYDPAKYVGTDSNKSIIKKHDKPRPVMTLLREHILPNTTYPYEEV